MRIYDNVELSPEAHELLLKNYWCGDTSNVEEISFLPSLQYVIAYKDADGNPITTEKLGYRLFRTESDRFEQAKIFRFDNGQKYFAVFFEEEFDEKSAYIVEYFDETIFLLKK